MPRAYQASVPLAGQAQMELRHAQNSWVAQGSELRSRLLKRVDQLVRGMEAVAQRSLLVARFNDLHR